MVTTTNDRTHLRSNWILDADNGEARKVRVDGRLIVPIWLFTASHLHLVWLCLLCSTHTPCWRRGAVVSVVRRMNEVTLCRARLVLRWVTVLGRVYHHAYVTSQLGQLSLASLRGR